MGSYYGEIHVDYIIAPPTELDLSRAIEWETLIQTLILDLRDKTDLLIHFTLEESGCYLFNMRFYTSEDADTSILPVTPSYLLLDSALQPCYCDTFDYLPEGDYYFLFTNIAGDCYSKFEMWPVNLGEQLETSGGLLYEASRGSATIIGHTDPAVESIALPVATDKIMCAVSGIAEYAFVGYENLRSVDLSEVRGAPKKYIGRGAFLGTAMESITLGKNWYLDQYSVGYDADYNPIEGFTIYGYKGSDAHRYAVENGFIFVNLWMNGDLNGDALVDANDASVVLKTYAQSMNDGQTVSLDTLTVGDVDSNGKLDSDDAVLILKVYANYILTGKIDWSVR